MKRWILVLLAVLMLCGCTGGDKNASDTVPTTEPPGMYIPEHGAEVATQGAVRAYEVTGDHLALTEDGVAVWHEGGGLCVYEIQEGRPRYRAANLGTILAVERDCVYYYDGAVCRYDYRTEKTKKWELPADMQGDFYLGTRTQAIYYCTEGKIWALDLKTGVSKMLKSHTAQQQALTGAYFDGAVLGWQTENGMCYLSSEDGTELCYDNSLQLLVTQKDSYYVHRTDGMVEQTMIGTLEGKPIMVNLPREGLVPLLDANGMLQITNPDWTSIGTTGLPDVEGTLKSTHGDLVFYDTTTGHKIAAVTIPNFGVCKAAVAGDGYVWLLTDACLYRWQLDMSPVMDDTVYTGPVYTAQEPDTEGLAALRERIAPLTQTHGVQILIDADAVADPGEHVLTQEHQIEAISYMLDQLEPLFADFPEGFLKQMVADGDIKICLVRYVNGGAGYVRYWVDGDCCLAISLGADMREAFYAGLGGVVDSHILGHSRDLEYWKTWNPKGFAYLQDQSVPEKYAKFVGEYFVDEKAMSFINEDRARTFYYAVMPGHEELFAQPVLQKKLKAICEGIREAYDLKKSPDTYLWEQYLEKSLAYVEKK